MKQYFSYLEVVDGVQGVDTGNPTELKSKQKIFVIFTGVS
jgi:hypothetical protein